MKQIIVIILILSFSFADTGVANITLNGNFTITGMQTYYSNFYDIYGPYILAVFGVGLSFIFGDRQSQSFLAGGVLLSVIGFFYDLPTLFLGGALFLVIGGVMKFSSG